MDEEIEGRRRDKAFSQLRLRFPFPDLLDEATFQQQ
jgi:hypothetical protein